MPPLSFVFRVHQWYSVAIAAQKGPVNATGNLWCTKNGRVVVILGTVAPAARRRCRTRCATQLKVAGTPRTGGPVVILGTVASAARRRYRTRCWPCPAYCCGWRSFMG